MFEVMDRSQVIPHHSRLWHVMLPWLRRRRIEAVEMCARRFFYQPRCFRWRGNIHRVYHIERVWEEGTRRHRAARRYFVVRCGDMQRYTLFHDLGIDTWHLVDVFM